MSTPYNYSRQKGMIREFLKTPFCKDIIRNNLRTGPHTDRGSLIRAVMEEDPEVFMSLVVSIPSLSNALLGSLAELGERIGEQYPPGVLNAFMESIAGEIDAESARKCMTAWKSVVSSLWESSPGFRTEIMSLVLAAGPGIVARGINGLAGAVNSLERERPGTVTAFVSGVFSNIERPEVSKGMKTFAGAFLDQKWHMLSWFFGFAVSRIKKRLGLRDRA